MEEVLGGTVELYGLVTSQKLARVFTILFSPSEILTKRT